MKLTVFIVISCLVLSGMLSANGQSKADSMENYLAALSNRSVKLATTYVEHIYLDSMAQWICQNASPEMLERLMDSLDQDNKVLVCHILLSRNLERGLFKFSYTRGSIDSDVYRELTYNNFSWTMYRNEEVSFDENEFKKVRQYWKLRGRKNLIPLRNCDKFGM